MSLSRARELREQRGKLIIDAQKLMDGEITTETRAKFDTMMTDADALMGDIERIEKAEAIASDIRSAVRPPENRIETTTKNDSEDRTAKHKTAFGSYLQHGLMEMPVEQRSTLLEYRDMSVGTNSAGGFLVPQSFVYNVEQALKYYGPMLTTSTIMPTATGAPMPYPSSNDTANVGAILAEGATVSTQDVAIGSVTLGAFKFTTNMVKVSLELLQDSAFDVQAFLTQQFGGRLGRILNTKFTVGAGTTEPKGILTAATAGPTAAGAAKNDGGAETGGSSIGSDDLVALYHSVDPLYRNGAGFMMHDSTLQTIRQLKDKQGRPLYQPGFTTGAPDTILGCPYFINNDLPTIALNAKTVLFGQLSKYLVRQVKELSVVRLNERFMDAGQVAFVGFARYDGNLIDAGTHPVKYLVQAAA